MPASTTSPVRRKKVSTIQKETDYLCGSICSNEDVLCRNVPFSDLQPGDILVFQNCGAYSFMEGMTTFLSREMPQIWSFSETDGPILLRDFIATDAFHIRKEQKK